MVHKGLICYQLCRLGLVMLWLSLQEGSLKRSVTSPASVCDWLTADYTSVDLSGDDKAGEVEEADAARQRTWSSRAFNSLLPQLQMKWRSRSSSGSFTKLVDSVSDLNQIFLSQFQIFIVLIATYMDHSGKLPVCILHWLP